MFLLQDPIKIRNRVFFHPFFFLLFLHHILSFKVAVYNYRGVHVVSMATFTEMEWQNQRECGKCHTDDCLVLFLLYFNFISDIILGTLLEGCKIIKSLI